MKPILEQVDLGGRRSILAFRFNKKDFDAPWHFHPQHELTYIEESVGTKFIGDYVGSYEPGELVLIRSNLPHCWKNQAKSDGMAQSIVVQWNKGIYAKVPELKPMFNMLRAASKGLLFSKADAQIHLPALRQLPHLSGVQLYLALQKLLVALSACDRQALSTADFVDDLPIEYGSRMSKIHDFVEAHFQRKIYLKEPARLINMSEQSFSRFFSKMMGRPFFSFLNEYRINVASRMLLDTDWSVSEICFASGYQSPPFFHQQFKRFMGLSPTQYRKRHAVESLKKLR